jgi:hypothetical protein
MIYNGAGLSAGRECRETNNYQKKKIKKIVALYNLGVYIIDLHASPHVLCWGEAPDARRPSPFLFMARSNFEFSPLTSPLQRSPLFSANSFPCTDGLQKHCRRDR